jgi:hypothetical protein
MPTDMTDMKATSTAMLRLQGSDALFPPVPNPLCRTGTARGAGGPEQWINGD